MATIGTAFLSEIHVGDRSRSDLIGRGLDPAPPQLGLASFIEKTLTRLECMKQTGQKEQLS
jgi:hypothetical protein